MPRDPKADAIHSLFIAKANYDLAMEAKQATRKMLNQSMLKAASVGVSKAEIARIVESSPQRVGQIISEHDD